MYILFALTSNLPRILKRHNIPINLEQASEQFALLGGEEISY